MKPKARTRTEKNELSVGVPGPIEDCVRFLSTSPVQFRVVKMLVRALVQWERHSRHADLMNTLATTAAIVLKLAEFAEIHLPAVRSVKATSGE